LNIQSALPLIEAAAKQSPTVPMQMSAIGALGLLGSSADIPLLENLLQGDEERLKPAVQHALAQIAARQNQSISPQIVSRK
jgi:HEAT repeat protein